MMIFELSALEFNYFGVGEFISIISVNSSENFLNDIKPGERQYL